MGLRIADPLLVPLVIVYSIAAGLASAVYAVDRIDRAITGNNPLDRFHINNSAQTSADRKPSAAESDKNSPLADEGDQENESSEDKENDDVVYLFEDSFPGATRSKVEDSDDEEEELLR
ncbi:hypothetical protein HDU76_009786, partial [Blyttiomyces sp. JEL0837]